MKLLKLKQTLSRFLLTGVTLITAVAFTVAVPVMPVFANTDCGRDTSNTQHYTPVIDIGCNQSTPNPILDAAYAIIRDLSAGAGLVVVASLIFAGIQYSTARGDPQATVKAVKRIQSSVIALFIFIFGYAFLNYIIPGGFIHP